MTLNGWLQIIVYFIVLLLLVKPVGSFIARVFQGERTFLTPVLAPVEKFIYRLNGVNPEEEMTWKTYAVALLVFSLFGILLLFLIQRLQGVLPLNPTGMAAVPSATAFNTAVSFVTNTNWQNYGGESTMSYLTQMMGLTVQNFLSAAAGLAVLMAFIRSFTRHSASTLGNFWVDLTRSVLYVLLPLSIILAMILVSQGVVQTFSTSVSATLTQPITDSNGQTVSQQVIAVGPVASQLAIKHLGTNGGGFFNANAAHPFENPNALTDFLLVLAQTIIPAALTYTFGKMVGEPRQGWAVLTAMLILLILFVGCTYAAESAGNPLFTKLGVDQTASAIQPGGNMEGKEVRFGIVRSSLFATTTTVTSTGAVDSMHDSYTPLGGFILLLMMQLGEVVLGGVGSGLYGMLIFVIVAVFVAGLMVGRTPEYLGKKIEPFEMKMAALLILIMPIVVLGLTALAVVTSGGQAGVSNPVPHGFSQILYAFTSQANNNGSAFAGLSGNTNFYNFLGALAMLIGRFWLAIPTLALAGSLAAKKKAVTGAGTLSTTSPLFIGWLIAIILVVGALNFVPALALGPVIEHLIMIGA
ncbi:MAG: potassium-transporting ATPase subunit KdpA [Chloroflexi bacterium]|nr:potassium-transporting ATPase subunit KdpA [Chloroflexota bacterium]